MNQPTRYRWKRFTRLHFLGAIPLFGVLYFPLDLLPGEDTGGMALLPALVFYLCRPRGRREWLLAAVVALGATAAELAGMLAGFAAAGLWPPRVLLTGSDAHQVVVAFAMLPGALVGFTAAHALGRESVAPAATSERTLVDARSWHLGLLACISLAGLFATVLVERTFADVFPIALPGFALMAFLILLSSGGLVLVALPGAADRKAALVGRFGLSLLIGFAGYAVYEIIYFQLNDARTGLTVLLTMVGVHTAAPVLGWWQLRNFARREGFLEWHPDKA